MVQSGDFLDTVKVGLRKYQFYSISAAEKHFDVDFSTLPFSHKILLENLLRHADKTALNKEDIQAFVEGQNDREIAYRPARVLMQDFTGVPAVVDLAAMREAVSNLDGDPQNINPLSPVDLVIDHSVMVDRYGNADAFSFNVEQEVARNKERYEFLKWGQKSFNNFRVVPPGTGICHQVNLEYLAPVVFETDEHLLYPDTVVGTDSHTTMINGLGVLGWGVGGIEAEAAMLGQPISMLLPQVVGFELTGSAQEGTTATDIVLTITQILREKGVVGKFVEFYGEGLSALSLADRATIANMAPEYGATCGFFPIDSETLNYLTLSGRDKHQIKIVEAYAKAQGLWREGSSQPQFNQTASLNLSEVEPSVAGPKRPQDRIILSEVKDNYQKLFPENTHGGPVEDQTYTINGGDIVIAAITSCTNTSNPSVMLAAGLVAQKAAAKGLTTKPWVKTSLAPGSQVVSAYLEKAGLQKELDALGFHVVGYGCTTCIGNSGPLDPAIEKAIQANDVTVCSVLSGNRNFEGRIHPLTAANYLASPPLVVAYAIAGNVQINLTHDPLGEDSDGKPVYLKDIWPTHEEIQAAIKKSVTPKMFKEKYAHVFDGDQAWQSISVSESDTYQWDKSSTYIKHPPYFTGMSSKTGDVTNIQNARILALLGDSVTTDHISPAGAIAKDTPAARYLSEHGVDPANFNSYGSRRGNHEVMMRGTFANIRIQNEITPDKTGGYTKYFGNKSPGRCYCPITLTFKGICKLISRFIPCCKTSCEDSLSIFDASERYRESNTPLVVIAGSDYGMGSSRDWAAKGTLLLGVKAVIAESFERIHRSNLVGMGVLPLTFKTGVDRKTLKLKGDEVITIEGIEGEITPAMDVECRIVYSNGKTETIPLTCRLDTQDEIDYYRHGGILHNVIRSLL